MRLAQLKNELEEVLKAQTLQCEGLEGSDNPQIIKSLQAIEAKKEMVESILDRINGNRIALTFYK